MFGSSLPPVVCKRAHVLYINVRYLCSFTYSGSPTYIVLCFCFVFLRLVYPMLPVLCGLSFFIAPSVFSNVHLMHIILLPNL